MDAHLQGDIDWSSLFRIDVIYESRLCFIIQVKAKLMNWWLTN